VASASADKTVRRWQTSDGKLLQELTSGITDGLYTLCWSPDGALLVAAGLAKNWQLWNVGDEQPVKTVAGHRDYIYRATFSPSGLRLATLGYTGQLIVWDVETAQPLLQENLPLRSAFNVAWSPDGAQLAITGADPRVMLVALPDNAR
jgi:WD40 repeat protein